MIILLRRQSDGNITIDTENLPDNLDEIVQDAFAKYTHGTTPEAMYLDKLSFIDDIVQCMHGMVNESEAVHDLMVEYFSHEIDQGEIPDEDDFLSMDFMEVCFAAGVRSATLYSNDGYVNEYHENRRVMQVLVRIIRAVMDYQADSDGSIGGIA